jgi:hypothetical protein
MRGSNMRQALTIFAAGATLAVGVVSATAVRAARPIVAGPVTLASACTPGTWVQTPANVPAAMGSGNLIADTIVSSTDAWAVGYVTPKTGPGVSLWEQWTGGSSWNVISDGAHGVDLVAITNFGPDAVWAVGNVQHGSKVSALISQWNGTTIARVTIPQKGHNDNLTAISGSSATDIWAAGTYEDGRDVTLPLLYHYNGTAWSLATAPAGPFTPRGVIDISPTNVYMMLTAFNPHTTDVYHYNGVAWSVDLTGVPIDFDFSGFVGSSGNDLYGLDNGSYSFVDRWNGTSWSHVGTPNDAVTLRGLSEGPVGTIWADGISGVTTNNVYVAENGVRQTNPPSVMTQQGLLNGIATGSGLVIAVGGQTGVAPKDQPIVLMSCS